MMKMFYNFSQIQSCENRNAGEKYFFRGELGAQFQQDWVNSEWN